MLAVALKHADAEALLGPLMEGGLDVAAIDARAWALARAVSAMGGENVPCAVLDLDWESGFLVFMHDGKVLFQRNLQEVGVGTLYRGVASQFDLTEEVTDYLLTHNEQRKTEDEQSPQRARIATLTAQYAASLTDELESSFAFAGHRYRDLAPRRLLVCGTGARVAGICEELGGRLKVTVERASVDAIARCADGLAEVCATPALMTAVGLAMYEA
jgi:Tfp pilus assembly PilM family ATPase